MIWKKEGRVKGVRVVGRETANILNRMVMGDFTEKVNLSLMEVRDKVILVRAFQAEYITKEETVRSPGRLKQTSEGQSSPS